MFFVYYYFEKQKLQGCPKKNANKQNHQRKLCPAAHRPGYCFLFWISGAFVCLEQLIIVWKKQQQKSWIWCRKKGNTRHCCSTILFLVVISWVRIVYCIAIEFIKKRKFSSLKLTIFFLFIPKLAFNLLLYNYYLYVYMYIYLVSLAFLLLTFHFKCIPDSLFPFFLDIISLNVAQALEWCIR